MCLSGENRTNSCPEIESAIATSSCDLDDYLSNYIGQFKLWKDERKLFMSYFLPTFLLGMALFLGVFLLLFVI